MDILTRQTLSRMSINEMDGTVILKFIKMLIKEGEVPIHKDIENKFIYAKGFNVLGYQTAKSAFYSQPFQWIIRRSKSPEHESEAHAWGYGLLCMGCACSYLCNA
jgi:hypothetical protein